MSIVSHNEKLREALRLAAMGFRIFPCHGVTDGKCDCGKAGCDESKSGKHPTMVRSWTAEATTDPDTIRSWWHRQPNANVGVACGWASDLAVVDTDIRPDGDGFESLRQMDPQDRTINEWETARARTGSGGYHIWLAWPDGCSLTVGSKIGGKNIDLRGEGGYVIAPPSVNGRGAYQWLDGPDELMQCPDWLLQFLSGTKAPAAPSDNGHGSLTFQVQHDLSDHPGAGEGQRNSELCRLTGAALASGVAPDEVMQQALEWNHRCRPPKAETGIRKSVWSLIAAELRTLKEKATAPTAAPTLKMPVKKRLQLVTRLSADVEEEVQTWLWKDRFPANGISLLAGPPGVGKSMLACDFAARVSAGRAWPDGEDCGQGMVLYATCEDNFASTVKPRLSAMGADHARIRFVDGIGESDTEADSLLALDLHGEALEETISASKDPVRLVIIDTVQGHLSGSVNTNNNASSRGALTPLKSIAERHGVAFLLLEHLVKSRAPGEPLNKVQGSVAFGAAPRAVWIVARDPEDREKRIAQLSKGNLTAGTGIGFRYSIAGEEGRPFVVWHETDVETSLEDMLSADGNSAGSQQSEAKDEFHRAVDWLRTVLVEPVSAEVLQEGWKSELLTERTVRRAKAHLLIGSQRKDGIWYWTPPPTIVIGSEVISGTNIAKAASD